MNESMNKKVIRLWDVGSSPQVRWGPEILLKLKVRGRPGLQGHGYATEGFQWTSEILKLVKKKHVKQEPQANLVSLLFLNLMNIRDVGREMLGMKGSEGLMQLHPKQLHVRAGPWSADTHSRQTPKKKSHLIDWDWNVNQKRTRATCEDILLPEFKLRILSIS